MKKNILGTSDAWSTSHLSQRTSKPVYYIVNCWISTVRRNYSSDREKLLKFEAESQEFANFFRSLQQFVQKVKGQNNFWQQNAFLTCSCRFLRSNKLEQIGKNCWDLETCKKSQKNMFFLFLLHTWLGNTMNIIQNLALGAVHKLRLQDEVSKNVHFLSRIILQQISTHVGRLSKKGRIL